MTATSTYLTYNNPIQIVWRDPIVYASESYVVVQNRIVLTELPDEGQRPTISGYSEVFGNTAVSTGQFKTNYSLGYLEFDPSDDGTTKTVNFWKKGIVLYPCSRVFVEGTLGASYADAQAYLEALDSSTLLNNSNLETLLWMGLG